MAPSPSSIAETSIKKVTWYAYSQLFTYLIVRQHETTKPAQKKTKYSAYHGAYETTSPNPFGEDIILESLFDCLKVIGPIWEM
jgi:hypothetical protein